MTPDTDRRSLRSLRSDRDDSKERGVAFYRIVSLREHPGKTTITHDQAPTVESIFIPFRWTSASSRLRQSVWDWMSLTEGR
jgi:hypothetical protein